MTEAIQTIKVMLTKEAEEKKDNMPVELPWRWCLVGNIVKSHVYGESKDVLIGTKHFQPGAKVYMAPANWGDGYEKIVVIGCPRRSRQYIEIIMKSDYIENFRLQKVYQPFLLKMMEESEYTWWNNSEEDQQAILTLIEALESDRFEKVFNKRLDNWKRRYADILGVEEPDNKCQ